MGNVLKLCLGLLVGLALGCLGFFGYSVVGIFATDCLKNCTFAMWPAFALVLLPIIIVSALHIMTVLRWRKDGLAWSLKTYDVEWFAKRSVPIGIALSSIVFTPWGLGIMDRFIRMVAR
ncbi:hypothetical protein Z946_2503 [Sulfitobacter noctilucicola]|uniref:Uncharacterized protein n=1 Tax=Sulfitobacter noctilucicola TaxID=1342301 RepID=A0A7W6M9C9_9RHOB|nr:hypothetical protein [Sulfitobacter noctilucicola]KIN63630.1 hypothetical protein Z946_2503 [Sulfitobacter noctilucicola]MBB4174859.1 hypothetical protein [Sulfitobacter noctilucicola]